jgi:EmrB/QacA subfamily drug resistance transporter
MRAPVLPAGRRSRGLALTVLCAATLMIILDGTIVTVALPAIQHDLGFAPASLSWVMNAYLIPFGGLLLLAGRLGDLAGRKRVFLAGLALFTAASLACGLSASPALLVGSRFVQGAGAALVSSVSLGMIATLYPEPPGRARAIAAYSFVGAAGASIGLILGGVLTQALSWHWIFFVNLPIGVAAGLPALRLLPADRGAGRSGGTDGLGAVLVTAGLMLAVYAIVQTDRYGATSPHTLGAGGAALALLAGFVLREATAAAPLLPLRIFAFRGVSGANLAQAPVIAAAFGFQVLITLYMQRVLGYGPAAAGLGLVPTAVLIGAVSLGLSARLGGRFGERRVLLAGLALVVVALALLTRLPAGGGYAPHVLPALLLFGAGGGLTLPALATLGMSGSTPRDAGVVSCLFNTTQQVGAALGVAVLTTVAAARTGRLQAAGLGSAAALSGGYRLAFGIGAILGLAALVLAATVLPRRASTPDAPDGPDRPAKPSARAVHAGGQADPGDQPTTTPAVTRLSRPVGRAGEPT